MKRISMTVAALAAMLVAGTASAADFSSWQKKMQITFAGYNPPGGAATLTNFPALVVLSTSITNFNYGDFQSFTNQDLRFTAADGTTELNYEIDSWNTNGSSYVWLQLPNLVDTNTSIYAWYGKSGQTAPAYTTNGATWTNGYAAVWHMQQTNGRDSTANANNGTANNNTNATGVVGGAQGFAGNGDVSVPYKASLGLNTFTMSAWVRLASVPGANAYGILGTRIGGENTFDCKATSTSIHADVGDGANWINTSVDILSTDTGRNNQGGNVPVGVWTLITYVTDNVQQKFFLYRDGDLKNTISYSGTPLLMKSGESLGIGDDASGSWGDEYMNGWIDEVRLASVARSPNWVWAEFMNMASNGVFNTYGAAGLVNADLPQVFDVRSQNLSDTSADVVGTLVTNGESTATVYLYWSTTDGTTNASVWTTGGSVSNLGSYASGATFTNTLTGLASGLTYYWNYSASNSASTVWGMPVGSPSFKTMGPPGVNNGAGPSAVGFASATLNGNLTNGAQAYCYVYYWTNGATSTNVVNLGLLAEGTLSTNLTGLNLNTLYYYQFQATNAYGSAWSDVTNFTTYAFSGYYVTPTGAGVMNGVNWANAFNNIQSAVNAAGVGNTICLQTGTYAIASSINVPNTSSGLTIAGGYAGSGAPGQQTNAPSILTGNGMVRVLNIAAATNITLSQLTVTGGGLGGGSSSIIGGAGLCASNSIVTVANCVFSNNSAATSYSDGVATPYGGAIYAVNNVALTVSNTIFAGNAATVEPTEDFSAGHGGAVAVSGGTGTFVHCRFTGNLTSRDYQQRMSTDYGGALYLSVSSALIRDCLIAGNGSEVRAGGIHVAGGTVSVESSDIVGNSVQGISRDGGTVVVTNSIVWDNGLDAAGAMTLAYCDVQTASANANTNNHCLSVAPLFERGLYLAADSPCVDAGGDTAANLGYAAGTTRADGTLETGAVDLGYHFTSGVNPAVADLYVKPNGDDTGAGTSWDTAFRTIKTALSLQDDGTRVHIQAGVYNNAVESMPLTIGKLGVQLLGTNAAVTVLNGAGAAPVLRITASCGDTLISGLSVNNGCTDASTGSGRAGAGIYAYLSEIVIADSTFTNNQAKTLPQATSFGGAVCAESTLLTISNCTFVTNSANWIYDWNYCQGYGGAVAAIGIHNFPGAKPATILNSSFTANWTTLEQTGDIDCGGALYLNVCTGLVRNCLLARNNADAYGDGMYVNAGTVSVVNVTFADNGGEGLRAGGGIVNVTDSILWNNGVDVTGAVALAWCDIGVIDPAATTNNYCLSTDPLFVNAADGDYHEQSKSGSWHGGAWSKDPAQSPCIDAGDPSDPRGALEPQPNYRNRINMGAYGGTAQASKSPPTGGTVVMFQ